MRRALWLFVAALAGCPQPSSEECASRVAAFADADGDGFGGASLGAVCALAEGQVEDGTDCDDEDPSVFPGAREKCDGLDQDCVDGPDQGLDGSRVWYQDRDGDGFGAQFPAKFQCGSPGPAWSDSAGDCDDERAGANPDAAERCNGFDDDCDGLADQFDDSLDRATLERFWEDADLDGYGDPGRTVQACTVPAGYADNDDDCAPTDPFRNPGAQEICNGDLDDDCDGRSDDDDSSVDPATMMPFFVDGDRDGWGLAGASVPACAAGIGRVANDLDCDDTDAQLNLDDDDGDTFTTCAGDCNDLVARINPVDLDGDGVTACDLVPDCAPSDGSAYPGAPEVTGDGVDQDCDAVDDCFVDLDQDEVGGDVVVTGTDLLCSGAFVSSDGGDCDDGDPTVDLIRTWYADYDLDGYGGSLPTGVGCYPPGPNDARADEDCDDGDAATNPGADEVCDDLVDQDCDGSLACCEILDTVTDAGWPADLPFNYCWSTLAPCAFPPVGATYRLTEDGRFTSSGYTGTWWVDEALCELNIRYDTFPNTVYNGVPGVIPTCFSGRMSNLSGGFGTWSGCF
jgi:hypothetical protein